jgi:hypothetical protein
MKKNAGPAEWVLGFPAVAVGPACSMLRGRFCLAHRLRGLGYPLQHALRFANGGPLAGGAWMHTGVDKQIPAAGATVAKASRRGQAKDVTIRRYVHWTRASAPISCGLSAPEQPKEFLVSDHPISEKAVPSKHLWRRLEPNALL